MRILLLLTAALTACAQSPNEALQQALGPVQAWVGRALVLIVNPPPDPAPFQRAAQFPQPLDPLEAVVTPGSVYLSIAQILSFRSSQELAEFLAHAAAHARLRHPERMAEVMTEVAILNTTHAPPEVAETLQIRTRKEMEEEAAPVTAEFMATSGCAPGPCQMFGLLLQAVRRR